MSLVIVGRWLQKFVLLAITLVLHSGLVSAFGMGELTLDSLLNQPFRAEIPLRDIGELNVDQIRVRLADATAFENADVDRSQFISSLQFKVELVGGGNGRIVVTSLSSVVEPYLDFIVEARWPNGKMIREYTVLLDLPVYADDSLSQAINLSNATSAASQNVSGQASSPSFSQTREPGGSIGAVNPAPPAVRNPLQQQNLPPAVSPSEYRIQHHDTMWRIATMLRPSSYVSTEQTMLALAKKNPGAFINGNVNQIKSGYVLRVPSEAEVREIDHQAAVEEIRLQAREWRGEKVARATKTKSMPNTASTALAAPMAPQLDATTKPRIPALEGADEAVNFSLGGADDNDSAKIAFGVPVAAEGKDIGRHETLLLYVTINTQLLPEVVRVEKLADGRLALGLATWNMTRLRLPDREPLLLPDDQYGYALESVANLTYKLDRGQLTLAVTAPASAFTAVGINQHNMVASLPDTVRPGVYFNYDSSVSSADQDYQSHGLLLEGTAFGSWGAVVSGFVFTGNRQRNQIVRTDSYWRKDLPGPMETLVLGDTIGDGGAWSRPARYTGIRWARDFALRPGFISTPMPIISGAAALPSTIDLLINNRRQKTEQVNPGPFELTNVPVTNGAGEINLIVRDLLGRETIINQSYYFSPSLLAKGLSDFSVEAGFLRENYGRQSNDYGNAFIAGTRRYGLTSALTVETRLEIQPHRQAVGGDVVAVLGSFATAQASVATASNEDIRGNHYLFGLERRALRGNGSLRWEHFDRDFVQFAAFANEVRPRERLSASLSTLLPGKVSAAINYTSQTSWDDDRLDLLTVNLGVTLLRGIYLSSYVSQDLGPEDGWSAGISFNLSLGGQRSASASTSHSSSSNTVSRAELSQSALGGGLGYSWGLSVSDDPNQQWRGRLTRNTNGGSFSAEASDTASSQAFRLGASGSVGWLAGHAFAARSIGAGSFAVVKVGSIENVPIYRSSQLIASTNGSGMALVPGLLPYQANQLTIDPVKLPFDVEIQSVKQIAVPFARSGLLVDFPVHRSRNALVVLRQVDGTVVPAGALVTVPPGDEEFLVGKRGEAYLMNLSDSNHLSVQWKEGACQLILSLDPAGPREPRIGPLTCGERP
jgi:outer membrane usher protein